MNYKMERYVGDAYCRAFHEATAIVNDFFESDKVDDRKSLIDVLNAVVEIFSGKLDMHVVNSFTNDEILGYLGALTKSIIMGYRFCNNPCEEEFDKIIDNIVKDKLFIMTPYIFNGAYHQWGHTISICFPRSIKQSKLSWTLRLSNTVNQSRLLSKQLLTQKNG